MWYHGTSERNYHRILEAWFTPQTGTWGKGVYFSSSKEGARLFGSHILKASIADGYIHHVQFSDNEAGLRKLMQQHEAAAVHYPSGEIELCVYNPRIIDEIIY